MPKNRESRPAEHGPAVSISAATKSADSSLPPARDNRLQAHRFAANALQPMPDLTPEQYDALLADIAADKGFTDALRAALFSPAIDLAMDPDNVAYFRPQWDHETFLPLTDAERQHLLGRIASVGGAR
jgi:hypothetical protein